MKILVDDRAARVSVVENSELGYYELRLGEETAGTLDYRDVGGRRVFGLTEIRSDLRGQEHPTLLIRTVFKDLDTWGAQVTNYCPAIDRYLRKHPEHHHLIDALQPGMSDRDALTRAGTPQSRLDAALRSEHARLHDLAAVPRSYLTAARQRRHGLDLFTAYAAQHLAASAEVLLGQARNWPPDEVSRYLSNLRKLEQALRVLKRREYGDKRYLDLGHDQVWFLIDQLLSEHEQLESVVAARIAADSDWDALAILAENLMTSQTSAADDLEGPVVPALLAALEVRLYGHSRHPDAAGPHQAWDPRRSRRC